MPSMKRKAILRLASGKKAGQFRFVLSGDNGEVVGGSASETYTQKHNAVKTLKKYFPAFAIVTDFRRISDKKAAATPFVHYDK